MRDADALMALMAQDKKVKRGRLTFILLKAVGRAVIAPDVEPSLVRDFLQEPSWPERPVFRKIMLRMK